MRRVQSEITIDAAPERVWAVLTDFAAHPGWNPFITQIDGLPQVGRKLTLRARSPRGRGMTFRSTVGAVDPGRHLGLLGRLLVPGLFDTVHEFVLTPTADGRTHLLQSETFSGVLVALLGKAVQQASTVAEQLNQALKTRVEQHHHV